MLGHSRALRDAGYASVALDMRAHGRSGGERIGLAFEEHRDVAAVLDWIEAQPALKGKPVALLGVSMGGAVALRTAGMRPDVDAVISVSAFASCGPHDSRFHGHDGPSKASCRFSGAVRAAGALDSLWRLAGDCFPTT